MLSCPFFFSSFWSRQQRHHRRRQQQHMRRPDLALPSNQAQPRPLQAHRMQGTELPASDTVFYWGDYALGDENCPFLYGPTDIRY